MSTRQQLQLVQGTTAQIASGTPAVGEIWVDTDINALTVGDGATPGGHYVPSLAVVGELVFRASGVNLNSVGDTAFALALPGGVTRYQVRGIQLINPSTSITTAQAAVYTGSGGGGVAVASPQALSALTNNSDATSGNGMTMTLALPSATFFNDGTLYFRVTTPQGGAATCDVAIQISPIS